MRTTSLKPLIDAGISSPNKYRDELIHSWYLPPEIVQKLAQYFQRKLSYSILNERINNGLLTVGKETYNVIWVNGPIAIKQSGAALLSFRYCKYLNIGYVLIKKLENGEDIETLQEQEGSRQTQEILRRY